MTASLEPRTAPGRRLAGRLRVIYPADHQASLLERDLHDILAIEEQAATEARRELLAKLQGPFDAATMMVVTADRHPRRLVEWSRELFRDTIHEPLRRLIEEGSRADA